METEVAPGADSAQGSSLAQSSLADLGKQLQAFDVYQNVQTQLKEVQASISKLGKLIDKAVPPLEKVTAATPEPFVVLCDSLQLPIGVTMLRCLRGRSPLPTLPCFCLLALRPLARSGGRGALASAQKCDGSVPPR